MRTCWRAIQKVHTREVDCVFVQEQELSLRLSLSSRHVGGGLPEDRKDWGGDVRRRLQGSIRQDGSVRGHEENSA